MTDIAVHQETALVVSGEVVNPASREESEAITAQLHQALENTQELIIEAFQKKVWLSLGYGSWNDYVTGEFAGLELNPPKEERVSVIASYHQAGMSSRAISAVTGLSKGTIGRELKKAKEENLVADDVAVAGLDGKVRTYSKDKGQAEGGPELFELSDELLDMPAAQVGVGSLNLEAKQKKDSDSEGKASKKAGEPAKKKASKPTEAQGMEENESLRGTRALMVELSESVKRAVSEHQDKNFASHEYSWSLVEELMLCLGSVTHLLQRLHLEPTLLGDDAQVAGALETVVSNLDAELLRIRS